MGNETSFRSFPAHVHHLLTVVLAETHVVHTKIYPRYRSKRNISFARDDFSKWLEPHEGRTTDVILLGHSMGGLLSGEVVLMPPSGPAGRPFKHRILGTINFDVPFLGMHPGVVKSGLASMFTSGEDPSDKWSPELQPVLSNDTASMSDYTLSPTSSLGGRTDTLWQPPQSDPNLNPSFNNDVILPVRKGWQNAMHFVGKHWHNGHFINATRKLVTSHMEFGGAMANYPELKGRYSKIRTLEAEDGNVRKSIVKNGQVPARVRFVNYYTACTGRPKKDKSPMGGLSPSANASRTSLTPSMADEAGRGRQNISSDERRVATERSKSPGISLEEHSDEGVVKKVPEIPSSDDEDWEEAVENLTIDDPQAARKDLPELPAPPPPLDVSYIKDAATRKLVEDEHARAVELYEKAVKERQLAAEKNDKELVEKASSSRNDAQAATQNVEKEIRDAQTAAKSKPESEMTHSEREALRLQRERERMEAEGRRLRGEPSPERKPDPPISVPAPSNLPSNPYLSSLDRLPSTAESTTSRSRSPAPNAAPKKDRKFCTLPPKDSNGERDPLWVRIFMENVDEVGAHCGLFYIDERYERLVGEVADRVERWVNEDSDARLAREASEGGEKR
jgi:pimeloyl-ACP methyl ester carboxylesterase